MDAKHILSEILAYYKNKVDNDLCTMEEIRRAVVMVGPTTSGKEFINTFVHEIQHLAVFIADGVGVDLRSESPAYLAGDTAMALAEVVCEMGCEHCRK